MARKTAEAPGPKPRIIDRQNRVALTADAMEALGVKPGDYVAFDVSGSEVKVHRVKWTLDKR